MTTILSILTAFVTSTAGQSALVGAGAWILGAMSGTGPYKRTREAVGRSGEALGVLISAFGNSRLGVLWNPIEKVILDFILFFAEQLAVGIRKNNPKKLEDQLHRLEDVGSQLRADAVATRLELLGETPAPLVDMQDARIAKKALDLGEQSIAGKLGDP